MSWLIAYGITNAFVALPLAGLALLVGQYSRRPALAHLLWIAVLVKLLTPPLIPVPVGWQLERAEWITQSNEIAGDATATLRPFARETTREAVADRVEPPHSASVALPDLIADKRLDRRPTLPDSRWPAVSFETLVSGAIWIWITGALVVGLRALYQGWRFQRVLERSSRSDDWLSARLASVAKQAGLKVWPKVVVADGTFSPMLWGLGRGARLIFPSELALRLDREACDSLLLHELAHYQRGDHWVRLLELVCQLLFWWNPVVWIARRGIEASEELCCDAWVVARQQGSPRSYAEALLATIDFLNEETHCLPPIASGLGEISLLRRRLTRIMLGDLTTGLSLRVKFAVIAAVVVVAPLGPALLADSAVEAPALVAGAESNAPVRLTRQKRLSRSTYTPAAPATVEAVPVSVATMPKTSSGPTRLRLPADHWATAVSPSGKHKFEARGGLKTVLVDQTNPSWNVNFTSNRITSVSFSPDNRFATGQEGDYQVRLWDAAGGFLRKLEGAAAAITSVAFSPRAKQVAAGAADGQVLVWDSVTGEKIAQLDCGAPVSCVRWSPSGERLAISTSAWNADVQQAQVLIWDPEQAQPAADFALDRPVSAIVWPRDETLVAVAWDGAGLAWNLASGDVLSQFDMGKDLPSAAAWSPDCPLVRQWIDGELFADERSNERSAESLAGR